MAMNNMGLGFVFTAKDLASGTMRGINANVSKLAGTSQAGMALMGKAMAGGAVAVGALAAGLHGLGAAVGAAQSYGEFGTQLEGVRVIMRGTSEDMVRLEEAAIKAGMATQFSPDETIAGLRDMATMGLSVNESIETLLPTLNLATASMGDLGVAGAAKAIVGTMKSFTSESLTAEGTADKLARITQLTNFQMKDFEIGLSKAAAVAGTFNTSLDDTLIALGLLRNRNIDASSAATQFREAQRRIASDKRAQKVIEKAGVKLLDESTGKMRSAISILLDFAEATDKMGTIERNRAVVQSFGARGLLAFSAIADAQTKVMTKSGEVTLKGAAAIRHLRGEISKANGTVKEFADARMGTFEGQLTLITGLLQTFENRVGKTFAEVFKPVVVVAAKAIEGFTNLWIALPGPVKTGLAGLFLAASAFVTGSGAIGLLVAALVLLLPVLKIVGLTMLALAAVFAPVIVAAGALMLAAVALKMAFERNLGGIADRATEWFDGIRLAWNALADVFSTGTLSSAVDDELRKAENQGIRAFVREVAIAVESVKAFFEGVAEGFSSGIDQLQPEIDRLSAAFDRLELSLLALQRVTMTDDATQRIANAGDAGESTGNKIARAAGLIIDGITLTIDIVTALADTLYLLQPAADLISNSIDGATGALDNFGIAIGNTDGAVGGSQQRISMFKVVFVLLGAAVAGMVSLWVMAFSTVVEITSGAIGTLSAIFGGLMDVIMMIGVAINAMVQGDWQRAWAAAKGIVASVMRAIVRFVSSQIATIAGIVDALGKAFGKDFGAKAKVVAVQRRIESDLMRGIGGEGMERFVDTRGGTQVLKRDEERAIQQAQEMRAPGEIPELAELSAELRKQRGAQPGVATGLEMQAASSTRSFAELGPVVREGMESAVAKINTRPIQVRQVAEIDGEVLYDQLAEIAQGRGATGFEPA